MDIVDKLKDRANAPTLAVSELNHDAADEIERLRAWVSVKTQEEARAHDYSVRMHDENARLREFNDAIIRYAGMREAAQEIERLNAEIARLREALKDARNNGLIYWEPRTERGHVSKAQMLSRIDAALAGEEKKS